MHQDRRREILKLLQEEVLGGEETIVSIKRLSDLLKVSEMTIRRDVARMEEAGEIIRSFGGISLNTGNCIEYTPPIRANNMPKEKKEIAGRAAEMVRGGQCLCIGTGSTLVHLAKLISGMNIIVTTSSISAAINASKGATEVHLVGGKLNLQHMLTTGYYTDNFYHNMNFDIAFVGTAGISLKGGVSEYTEISASIKRTMCERAAVKVLLVDHTKFSVEKPFKSMEIKEFDYIITDKAPDNVYKEYFKEHGVTLLLANQNTI